MGKVGWQVAPSSSSLPVFWREGGLVKWQHLYSLVQTLGLEGGSVRQTQSRSDTVLLTILAPMLVE